MSYKKQNNLPFASTLVHLHIFMGFVLLIFLVFCFGFLRSVYSWLSLRFSLAFIQKYFMACLLSCIIQYSRTTASCIETCKSLIQNIILNLCTLHKCRLLFLLPTSFKLFGFPTFWIWLYPINGYPRNASCALILISTFFGSTSNRCNGDMSSFKHKKSCS